jgi:hypothetical protein
MKESSEYRTTESNPRRINMKKNRMAQRGAAGSVVTAYGYTTKARPGPYDS